MSALSGLGLVCIAAVALTAYLGLLAWTPAVALIALIAVLFYLATTLYWARDISARIAALDDKLRRLEGLGDHADRVDALEDRLIRIEGTRLRPELVDATARDPRRLEAMPHRESEGEDGQRTETDGAT